MNINYMPAISPEVYEYISEKRLPFCNGDYLEIGSYSGRGIAYLARKFPNKIFYSVEPFIQETNNTVPNFVEYTKTCGNIVLFPMISRVFKMFLSYSIILPGSNFREKNNIDTILVDGSHVYHDVVNDINICIELLKNKKGFIFFHDALGVADIRKAIDEFKKEYNNQIISSEIEGDGEHFLTEFK